jgi:hypothetical protein
MVVVELNGTMLASREAGERYAYAWTRMEVKVVVLFRGTSLSAADGARA